MGAESLAKGIRTCATRTKPAEGRGNPDAAHWPGERAPGSLPDLMKYWRSGRPRPGPGHRAVRPACTRRSRWTRRSEAPVAAALVALLLLGRSQLAVPVGGGHSAIYQDVAAGNEPTVRAHQQRG